MIDLSLPGLIGSIVGIILAAIVYYVSIGALERAMRTREWTAEHDQGDVSFEAIRRIVFTIDLVAFAALGYWLGRMFDE
jgi:hypothetical protein